MAFHGLKSRLSALRDNIEASADSGILTPLRSLGLLYGPIDRNLPAGQALRKSLARRIPSYVGWRHAFGGIAYLLFMMLVITGVLLSFYYRPSVDEAYHSIQYIVADVPFGWLIRDLHVWAATLIVIALMAHMARAYFSGAYKPPRETSWTVGIILLFVVLAFGSTGYLLPWDQWSYWTVTELLGVVRTFPILGGFVADLVTGDDIVSGATLSRFFAIHVIILPWIAFGLLSLHFIVLRKHGVAPPIDAGPDAAEPGIPFYPDHLLRSVTVGSIVLAIAISLAVLFPRPVGLPASPFETPDGLVSTWIAVDVTHGLIRFLGNWGFVGFTLLAMGLMLIPLFDRGPDRRLRDRPLVAAIGLLFFVGFVAAWIAGATAKTLPGDTGVGQELVEERAISPVPTGDEE